MSSRENIANVVSGMNSFTIERMAVQIVAFAPQNIIGFVSFFSWLSVHHYSSIRLVKQANAEEVSKLEK
jgi:hypothetical protein